MSPVGHVTVNEFGHLTSGIPLFNKQLHDSFGLVFLNCIYLDDPAKEMQSQRLQRNSFKS